MSANTMFVAANDWSRRDIDMAIGVLIALRHCSERDAFNELAAAVTETGIGLSSISHALVTLASGRAAMFDHSSEVARVWGDLIGREHGLRTRAI